MRIVVALGGNALLQRGEPMTADRQRRNVRVAATQLAPVADGNELVISHGNGPQVGLLALQGAAYPEVDPYPLDVLGAQTEGGNASKSFTLVYGLNNLSQIYQRFPGVEGSYYFVAGIGVNYQRAGRITLAPMRAGVGLRAGANIGYLAYTRKRHVLPF